MWRNSGSSMWHHFQKMNSAADVNRLTRFLPATVFGEKEKKKKKEKKRRPPFSLICIHDVKVHVVFGFVNFHLQITGHKCRQYDGTYRAIPSPISGIVSSVDCQENITGQFATPTIPVSV